MWSCKRGKQCGLPGNRCPARLAHGVMSVCADAPAAHPSANRKCATWRACTPQAFCAPSRCSCACTCWVRRLRFSSRAAAGWLPWLWHLLLNLRHLHPSALPSACFQLQSWSSSERTEWRLPGSRTQACRPPACARLTQVRLACCAGERGHAVCQSVAQHSASWLTRMPWTLRSCPCPSLTTPLTVLNSVFALCLQRCWLCCATCTRSAAWCTLTCRVSCATFRICANFHVMCCHANAMCCLVEPGQAGTMPCHTSCAATPSHDLPSHATWRHDRPAMPWLG